MAIIASKLYKALKALGLDDKLAEEASEEVANTKAEAKEQKHNATFKALEQDNKIDRIEAKVDKLQVRMEALDSKFNLLMGGIVAIFAGIVVVIVTNLIK